VVDDDRIRELADSFCAGTKPPQNGLEERLDMIAAQLAVIANELHRMAGKHDERDD
jgi:hypothetical protein